MLPRTGPGVLIPAPKLAWNVSSREAGSWRAPFTWPEVDILEMRIVTGTEAHRRHILTMVPDWDNRPIFMRLALGPLAVYNLRPSDHTPVEEVNILWAPEGGLHMWAHNGVLFTCHWFSWRTFERVLSSSAPRRIMAKMMALEGLYP